MPSLGGSRLAAVAAPSPTPRPEGGVYGSGGSERTAVLPTDSVDNHGFWGRKEITQEAGSDFFAHERGPEVAPQRALLAGSG